MKLSVVIPAYNEAKYLRRCLNAVLAQSAVDEVIVVDNASTDTTVQIAQEFAARSGTGSRVRIIHEVRQGVNFARQRGFDESKNKLVAFVDADTNMPPEWSEKMIREFEGDANVVCASGPYVYYDQSFIGRVIIWLFWLLIALPGYLVFGYLAIAGNVVVRRDAFEQVGGFDTSITFYGDDADLARRLHHVGICRFSMELFMYSSARRIHGEGLLFAGARYIYNYLSVVFTRRPRTLEHRDIR